MCGICGIIDLTGSATLGSDIEGMSSAASHRGPDDTGLALFGPCGNWESGGGMPGPGPWTTGLGHRRLSVLDLSPAGHQPMSDKTGRYWMVLNGEIYNFLELREELEKSGARFFSRSDTEVALLAFIHWGTGCLQKFNGMWALAVYDRQLNELFLARDRFGVKPLYYFIRRGMYAFASEIKQLLQLGACARRVNLDLLSDFLFWGFEGHTDDTFFGEVKALPAGHSLRILREDVSAGEVCPERYWWPEPEPALPPDQATNRFRDLLTDAVKLRLRSDVPVGVTLSGGLDSSSVTCIAANILKNGGLGVPLRAFTAVFPDPNFSEQTYAAEVSQQSGAVPIYVEPGSRDLEQDWNRFVWTMDEPFSSLSFYANWKIYKEISQHGIPVILNGQGGDELLLGYDRYRVPLLALDWRQRRYGRVLAGMLDARRHAGMSLVRQLAYIAYFGVPGARAIRRRLLVRPFLRDEFYQFGRSRTEHLYRETQNTDRVDWQVAEFSKYQLPHLLHHEDRVSMSFSIESRSPFLDYRLLNFMLGQETRLFQRDGWSKAILRDAMCGILPDRVRLRKVKMGFDTPTGRLIRDSSGFFIELMRRNFSDPIIDVKSLMHAFNSGRVNETFLCSACSYLSWKETFGLDA